MFVMKWAQIGQNLLVTRNEGVGVSITIIPFANCFLKVSQEMLHLKSFPKVST